MARKMPKKWTDEELEKLAKKKLNLDKLKDKNVELHPEISTWRSSEKPDLQLLRSLNRGQIQPIIFREHGEKVQLLAGSRRYSHLKLLGRTWEEIEKNVRKGVSDREALILALSENLYRRDLSPMEEARAIGSLLKSKMGVKGIAKMLDKSQSWVRGRQGLLKLPEKIREIFEVNEIDFGYSIPLGKLDGMEQAQMDLLESIASDSYGSVDTIEEAEKRVQEVLAKVKQREELLAKYGPCPECGSRNITDERWGSKDRLVCRDCEHEWHKETKEPWEYFELKQKAQELGLELELETPGGARLTPREVSEILKEREAEKATEEVEDIQDKFRCELPLLRLLSPMIEGDNIQKLVIDDDKIEIRLIEGTDLRFNGLRKDYKAGEKCRVEVKSTWNIDVNEMVKKTQAYIDGLPQAE